MPGKKRHTEEYGRDDHQADGIYEENKDEGDNIGPNLRGVLQRSGASLSLSHPETEAMQRILGANGVEDKILQAIHKLNCNICAQLGMPPPVRVASLMRSTEFHDNMLFSMRSRWSFQTAPR